MLGSIIGETQNDHIGFVDQVLSSVVVFTKFVGNGDDFNILAICQAISHLQTSGTSFPVNEYLGQGEETGRGSAGDGRR